jgi:hypothetical protein
MTIADSIYKPGDRVLLENEIKARIDIIQLTTDNKVRYFITWWSNGKREEGWFDRDEFVFDRDKFV